MEGKSTFFYYIFFFLSYIYFGMRYFLIIILVCGFGFTALASDTKRSVSVVLVENYLNSLTTAKARFLQTAQDGSQLIGTFYLNRPGKLRFEYDDPIDDFVVADGFFIYFYDAELGEQTNAPIGQTFADFLLRSDLRLRGDVAVMDVVREGGLLQVKLAQSSDPGAGSLTLGFSEKPLALKKWRISDPQGLVTEIELFQLQTNLKLPDKLFVYSNPKFLEKAPRYND